MIDAGYFAKRVEVRPEWFSAPQVREICSVSECVSSGPDGWVEFWLHNDFGWFNTIADAFAVVPAAARPDYRLFAYRIAPYIYRHGERLTLPGGADVHPEPITDDFRFRGFDAMNKCMESVLGLQCSPLSCNHMAEEMTTNEFCLFQSFDEASLGAERFSMGGAEPGDYYIIQVLEAAEKGRPTSG